MVEVYLLRHNISLDSIKQMSDKEIQEYTSMLITMDEIEQEKTAGG